MPTRYPSRATIGPVTIGRKQGKYPTVIIPSMFYEGHKIVQDPVKGVFEHVEAERQLNYLERIQDETGTPILLDLVGQTASALQTYVDWVLNHTSLPLAIDGISMEVRLPVAKWLCEIGAQSRVLYNSIGPSSPATELEALHDLKYPTCVVLLADSAMLTSEHRIKVLEKMLKRLAPYSIPQILVDTMVIDRPSIGSASSACKLVKTKYDLPVGCAPGNTYREWEALNVPKTYRSHAAIYASSSILPVSNGADFIFSGPTRIIKWVSRAVSVIDAMMAQEARWGHKLRIEKTHPLFKVFRD